MSFFFHRNMKGSACRHYRSGYGGYPEGGIRSPVFTFTVGRAWKCGFGVGIPPTPGGGRSGTVPGRDLDCTGPP